MFTPVGAFSPGRRLLNNHLGSLKRNAEIWVLDLVSVVQPVLRLTSLGSVPRNGTAASQALHVSSFIRYCHKSLLAFTVPARFEFLFLLQYLVLSILEKFRPSEMVLSSFNLHFFPIPSMVENLFLSVLGICVSKLAGRGAHACTRAHENIPILYRPPATHK